MKSVRPARASEPLCQASHVWDGPVHVRCVLPNTIDGHELARDDRGQLGLPVRIHRDHDGREWTRHGEFKRAQPIEEAQ